MLIARGGININNLFIQGLTIDWTKISMSSYLRKIDAIKCLDTLDFNKPVTFFAGENGSGKSTLLEAIAVAYGFNPEGGTKNYSFSTYDSHSELCDAIRIVKGIRRPRWGYFLRADGVYIFDEPEAALSPQRQLTLLMDIYKCAKAGAQFIIVTHSPILLGIPDADIYCFDKGELYLCK